MRKVLIAMLFLGVGMGGWGVVMVAPVWGAEMLTITQDHLELRSEPRAVDETFLSTVRKGTTVEWTGKTSGDWFEVQAPNGQVGWVHKSGISAPQTPPRPTSKPAVTEQSTGTRSIAATTSVSALEKKIKDLEKANSQYKTRLEEKEKQVGELSKDIKNLEQKITELSTLKSDSEQLQTDQAALDELQERIDTLNATLLLKNQELTVAQNQFTHLQTKLSSPYPLLPWISYGANGLLLLGVCVLGLLYVRRKKHGDGQSISLETLPPEPSIEPLRPQVPDQAIITASKPSAKAGDNENMLVQVVKVPSAVPQADIIAGDAVEAVDEIEDLEEREDFIEPDIIEELDELEKVEDVEEAEDIEVIGVVEESAEVETVAIEAVEEIEAIEEEDDLAGHEVIELVEDIAPEEIEEIEEITEVEDLVEELGSSAPEESDAEVIAEVFIGSEAFPQGFSETDALYDELEELENYLNEDEIYPVGQPDTVPEGALSAKVDVSGETFEVFVHPSTQIIAPEEEEYLEEEVIEEIIEEDIEEIEEIEESESLPSEPDKIGEEVVIEEIEELEELSDETDFETEATHEFEPEEPPKFLEPSPILIEPEYEPAEAFSPPPQVSFAQEARYNIELVRVGKNKDQILGLLSKIQGLPQSPQELVDATPSLIARGAKEQDARNFQMVMQKLGAEIRLIKA